MTRQMQRACDVNAQKKAAAAARAVALERCSHHSKSQTEHANKISSELRLSLSLVVIIYSDSTASAS